MGIFCRCLESVEAALLNRPLRQRYRVSAYSSFSQQIVSIFFVVCVLYIWLAVDCISLNVEEWVAISILRQ